jgi:peroxiredoxin
VDPRTFLPPARLPIADPPEVGEQAPDLPDEAAAGEGPLLIAFVRHTGCPFAESTLRDMRERARANPNVRWIAVSHSPPDATAAWCEAVGGSGPVEVVVDEGRRLYARWGLGRTDLRHFMGLRSLRAAVSLARQRGIRNRHPHGSRWQRSGTFVVADDGRVAWRHLPEHAGDTPDLADALAAASGRA